MTTIIGWNVEGLVKSFDLACSVPLDLKLTTEPNEYRVGGEAVVVGKESEVDLVTHTVCSYLIIEETLRPGVYAPLYYHEKVSVELEDLQKALVE